MPGALRAYPLLWHDEEELLRYLRRQPGADKHFFRAMSLILDTGGYNGFIIAPQVGYRNSRSVAREAALSNSIRGERR